eukprot:GHVU01106822.1.p1 GENE.GHVU01106822.1~~GHVU01106822.1.p1  ORF type:complete len:117 (-),score=2.80 GHVU01106822.1:208-558(-)
MYGACTHELSASTPVCIGVVMNSANEVAMSAHTRRPHTLPLHSRSQRGASQEESVTHTGLKLLPAALIPSLAHEGGSGQSAAYIRCAVLMTYLNPLIRSHTHTHETGSITLRDQAG